MNFTYLRHIFYAAVGILIGFFSSNSPIGILTAVVGCVLLVLLIELLTIKLESYIFSRRINRLLKKSRRNRCQFDNVESM